MVTTRSGRQSRIPVSSVVMPEATGNHSDTSSSRLFVSSETLGAAGSDDQEQPQSTCERESFLSLLLLFLLPFLLPFLLLTCGMSL